MDDSQLISNQLKQFKKKLDESIKARDNLERTYELQFSTLTDFINRLSNVCKGQDIELDNKLAKLRKSLSTKADLENISPQLEDIGKLLKQHTVTNQKNMQLAQSTIMNAGKQLQKLSGIPEDVRRELRALLKTVETPNDAIVEYLPQLDQLVRIYNKVLSSKHKLSLSLDDEKTQSSVSSELTLEISQEIQNLLGEIAFSGADSAKITQIREQLIEGMSLDQLLECCLVIIQVIVKGITQERKSAESFLHSLSDALNDVHVSVKTSIDSTQSSASKSDRLNKTLKRSVSSISKSIKTADDISKLKVDISSQVTHIAKALTEKENLEREEREELLRLLNELQNQLNALEKEAEEYRKKLSEQRFKSLQDPLTKLPNRAAYDERMALEYGRWQRYNKPLSVAVADIDHFKSINDTYGHAAGDKTLKVIAKTIKTSLRETDFVARFGGEEFIILLPETDANEAIAPLEKVRTSISKIPFMFKQKKVTITISIGVATFENNDTPQITFDRADEALYEAKNNGRDQVVSKS